LAFVVDKSLKAKDLINTILKAAKNYEINNSNNYNSDNTNIIKANNLQNSNIIESIELYDIYKGSNLPENKISYTFAIQFRSNYKTLKDNDLLDLRKIIISAVENIGGNLRQ
ncbi:MAG: hypothetical protein LBT85_02795, partial [Bifidobacteriaceae bacterium]|nr:hypothetical protein [Bifidobacteriaceae bacterium]